MLLQKIKRTYHPRSRWWNSKNDCVVCGSKAIGINFGAATCAPCKAFFRRNARRKEILEISCPFQNRNSFDSGTTDSNDTSKYCTQIRYCSSCRLRRCFDMGMKEELVRTDEENERYRQLVDMNRRRRQELLQKNIEPKIETQTYLLCETDINHISKIVYAYDTYCLKNYLQQRKFISQCEIENPHDIYLKLNYHTMTIVNTIKSFVSFVSSIPTVKALSTPDFVFLCKHNIRPLILLNLHELNQLCYSEPWQLIYDNQSIEYICGKSLFPEYLTTKHRAEQVLINDPVVTRLWLLVLFFSTPLHCYYDNRLPDISDERRVVIMNIQHLYVNLLWNYLLHRHGDVDAIRIFSNLTGIYLRMQRISQAVNKEIRTRYDLSTLHEAFNRAVVIDVEK